MKTSLGIWAMGPMVTRFVPVATSPSGGRSTAEKVHTAVAGLGDLIDDYEFHYPQELSEDNLDDVRGALDGHGIYAIATGLHLDPASAAAACLARRRGPRRGAAEDVEGADFAGRLGAHFIIWPGIEGYNYPFQTPYAQSVGRFIEGIGRPR